MEKLSQQYWEQRYQTSDVGWDLGMVSTPMKTYIDQLTDKSIKILIPGGGNSYEAEYLVDSGFQNVHVVDFSKTALDFIKQRVPEFPTSQLWQKNFFDLKQENYFDLVLEQTFFCALDPTLRPDYVSKMFALLKPKGKLVGVMFDQLVNDVPPPFVGDKEEYLDLFKRHFQINSMEACYNSVENRLGKELFVNLTKKQWE